jgi:hypothetical protein
LISLNKEGNVCFVWELEVRAGNWKGNNKFPFNSINCIERKDYHGEKMLSLLKNFFLMNYLLIA